MISVAHQICVLISKFFYLFLKLFDNLLIHVLRNQVYLVSLYFKWLNFKSSLQFCFRFFKILKRRSCWMKYTEIIIMKNAVRWFFLVWWWRFWLKVFSGVWKFEVVCKSKSIIQNFLLILQIFYGFQKIRCSSLFIFILFQTFFILINNTLDFFLILCLS